MYINALAIDVKANFLSLKPIRMDCKKW